MKKKIVIALLAVALVVGGVAGGVYAVNGHQPVTGEKLVGAGTLGIQQLGPATLQYNTVLSFTNPDCVGEITITQVSIIKRDWELGPTVVYEGPYIRVDSSGAVDVRTVITRPMKPHEGWSIVLGQYMYNGVGEPTDNSSWLSVLAAMNQAFASYAVEIAWEAKGNVCPLIGVGTRSVYETNTLGEKYNMMSQGRMVNMTQRAK